MAGEHVPTPQTKETARRLRSLGFSFLDIAKRMRISVNTLKHYYDEIMEEALGETTARVTTALLAKADDGDVRAQEFWLKNKGKFRPETYINAPELQRAQTAIEIANLIKDKVAKGEMSFEDAEKMMSIANSMASIKRSESDHEKTNERQNIYYDREQKSITFYKKDGNTTYKASPTGQKLHESDAFIRLIMGPYGSGKSTACLMDIIMRTCDMPAWHNSGRRKARFAFVRNTSGELKTTTLASWLTWADELGTHYKRDKPVMTYTHTFYDQDGCCEVEILFIALDRPDDVRKLKSLELTGVYINEANEVPQAVLSHMQGRVGRYPSKAVCGVNYWAGIILDTNPPDEDHWIKTQLDDKQGEGVLVLKQPAALFRDEATQTWVPNPNADNAQHLPPDYYTRLAMNQTMDFVKVFCLGLYGIVSTGKLIFTDFNIDIHAMESIPFTQGLPIYLGWDFGITPACAVVQIDSKGRLLVLAEYVSDGIGIRSFAEQVVLPGLRRDFQGAKIGGSYGDPAGNARDTIEEELSCIGELNALGIETVAARTNDIEPRLAGIRHFLTRMTEGKPTFYVDKSRCKVIVKGMARDYVYKRLNVRGEERYKDVPDKNFCSHIIDALQYVCLELASDGYKQDNESKNKDALRSIYNPTGF